WRGHRARAALVQGRPGQIFLCSACPLVRATVRCRGTFQGGRALCRELPVDHLVGASVLADLVGFSPPNRAEWTHKSGPCHPAPRRAARFLAAVRPVKRAEARARPNRIWFCFTTAYRTRSPENLRASGTRRRASRCRRMSREQRDSG